MCVKGTIALMKQEKKTRNVGYTSICNLDSISIHKLYDS